MEKTIRLKKSVMAAMAIIAVVLFILYQLLNVYAFSVVTYFICLASLPALGWMQEKE